MEMKIIKVTDKGQISLPSKMRGILGIKQGDKLLAIQSRDNVVLKKVSEDDFSDLIKHSEKTAKKLWGNKKDEIWNKL